MKLTVNTNHLALIDRVVDAGMIGKTREAVLNSAVRTAAATLSS